MDVKIHVLVGLCLVLMALGESESASGRGGGPRRRPPQAGPGTALGPSPHRRPTGGPAKRAYRQPPLPYLQPVHHKWHGSAPYRPGPPPPPKFKRGTHFGPPHPQRFIKPHKFRYPGPPRKTRNPGKYAHMKPSMFRVHPNRQPFNPYGGAQTKGRPAPPPYASLPEAYPEPHSTHYGKPHPTHGSPEPPTAHKPVSPSEQPAKQAPTSYVSFYKTDPHQSSNDLYDSSASSYKQENKEAGKTSSTSYGYKQTHHYSAEEVDDATKETSSPSQGSYGYKKPQEAAKEPISWSQHKSEPQESKRSQFQPPKQTFGFIPYDDPAGAASAKSGSFSMVPSKSYYVGSTVEHSPQTSPVLSPNYYDDPSSSASAKL